jgi:hypothetical protein
MAEVETAQKPIANWENVRDEWVGAVVNLVARVEEWCRRRDWPTRRIEKQLVDSPIGQYEVPALLIQVDLRKLLLEPVSRFVQKWEGVIDLYQMPQYDDVASIYRRGGQWYCFREKTNENEPESSRSAESISEVDLMAQLFTEGSFAELILLKA